MLYVNANPSYGVTMRKPGSITSLEALGRIRLSKNFFMRDFLYSEIANLYGIPNIPHNPDLAIKSGARLCEELLEPLQATFGRIGIRSAYRSPEVNDYGNKHGYDCASNEKNAAAHIWDALDVDGCMGATACIVIPWFADRYTAKGEWRRMAWWVHDHLPYSEMCFFPNLSAFNLSWHERPKRRIDSYAQPKGCLTKSGMDNHEGDHAEDYEGFPPLIRES